MSQNYLCQLNQSERGRAHLSLMVGKAKVSLYLAESGDLRGTDTKPRDDVDVVMIVRTLTQVKVKNNPPLKVPKCWSLYISSATQNVNLVCHNNIVVSDAKYFSTSFSGLCAAGFKPVTSFRQ